MSATGFFYVRFKEVGKGYEDCLRYLMGKFSVVLLRGTRADQMETDPRERGVSSVKNFLTLRASLRGGELPIPGSMQAEPGGSLKQDAVRDI